MKNVVRTVLLSAILCLLYSTFLFGQSPDTLWTKVYSGMGSDYSKSGQQTTDGGYVIAGSTNSFGAGAYDVYLIKTDANGDTLWTKTYGGADWETANSVYQTTDNGYILAGYTESFGAGAYDIYLIKTDSNGDTLWTKTHGGTGSDEAFSVRQTTDGGYILAGYTGDSQLTLDVYLIKTDANGDILWTNVYGWGNRDIGYSVQQTADGGYIITGMADPTESFTFDVYLIKTDSNGDTLWTKTYGGTNSDYGYSVQQTTDGGYVIAGYTESYGAGNCDVYLIKTDSNGDTLWTKTYGGESRDIGRSVDQTADDGYVIAGYTSSFGSDDRDVYVIRTDASGDTLWTKYYGGEENDEGWAAQQTLDNDYIVVGTKGSFGPPWDDVWLLKIGNRQIIGDFNHDSYVDATDLQMFGDHWFFVDTDPGWDAMYDLDPDGVIDAADLQIFGDHWLEGPPESAKVDGSKGPNSGAGIVFDLDATTAGNQNLTHIAPQPAGTMIRVDVYATDVHNLDTYEFNVVYDTDALEYISCAATNPLTYEENILTKNGGEAIGWMVKDNDTTGVLNIAYTLSGTDTTQAPEGEGLIADIVFQAKVTTYGMLSFSNVYYYDTFGVKDAITNTGTATLPVELSAFTATYNTVSGYTTLSWTTASETDILGYNVYRSTEDAFDASKQMNADMIEGHGTTTEMNTYEFVDLDQLNVGTTYYYWLESVEYGGISTVYTSIKLTPEEGTGGFEDDFIVNSLSNYPNPFRNTTTISYSIKGMLKSEPVQISIYNMLGQLVDTVEGRYGTATWNTNDHSTGIYFYKLNTDSYTEIKKMILSK